MTTEPVTVSPEVHLSQLVDDYIYHYHFKMFPVVADGKLLGCVTTRHLREVPRDEWPERTVGEITEMCSDDNTIPSTTDAMHALSRMSQAQMSRAMVVDGGRLVGVIALKDMMQFLSTKIELGDDA